MRKTIANKGQRPKTLTGRTVKRIARAVNAFERGDRDIPPGSRDRGPLPPGSDARLCQTTGDWAIGATETISVLNGYTGETLEAVNHYANIKSGMKVVVAQVVDDGVWYVISTEHESYDVIVDVELTDTELVFKRKRIWAIPVDTTLDDLPIPVSDCQET